MKNQLSASFAFSFFLLTSNSWIFVLNAYIMTLCAYEKPIIQLSQYQYMESTGEK